MCVCLSGDLCKNYKTDSHKTQWKHRTWTKREIDRSRNFWDFNQREEFTYLKKIKHIKLIYKSLWNLVQLDWRGLPSLGRGMCSTGWRSGLICSEMSLCQWHSAPQASSGQSVLPSHSSFWPDVHLKVKYQPVLYTGDTTTLLSGKAHVTLSEKVASSLQHVQMWLKAWFTNIPDKPRVEALHIATFKSVCAHSSEKHKCIFIFNFKSKLVSTSVWLWAEAG